MYKIIYTKSKYMQFFFTIFLQVLLVAGNDNTGMVYYSAKGLRFLCRYPWVL
jgi:hypothetical protein